MKSFKQFQNDLKTLKNNPLITVNVYVKALELNTPYLISDLLQLCEYLESQDIEKVGVANETDDIKIARYTFDTEFLRMKCFVYKNESKNLCINIDKEKGSLSIKPFKETKKKGVYFIDTKTGLTVCSYSTFISHEENEATKNLLEHEKNCKIRIEIIPF